MENKLYRHSVAVIYDQLKNSPSGFLSTENRKLANLTQSNVNSNL